MTNVVKFKNPKVRDFTEEVTDIMREHVGERAPESVLLIVEDVGGFTTYVLGDCYTFGHMGVLKVIADDISDVKRNAE